MRRLNFVAMKTAFILLLLLILPCSAVEISDPARHFNFLLPDGYIDNPMAHVQPPIVRALYLPSQTQNPLDGTFVSIEDMNGVLAQQDLSNYPIPPGSTLFQAKWKDFDINVFRSYVPLNGIQVVQYSAQIPLVPHAIQLTFISASTHEANVAELMQVTVPTVEGSTNWQKSDTQFERIVKIVTALAGIVVIALGGYALYRRYGPEGRETRGFSHAAKWF